MKKHVLLVNEDRNGLRVFMEAMDQAGIYCKCTYALSCEHAIQMLEYLAADGLFIRLDPDVTGNLEYVRKIKKNRQLQHIPLIVYCADMVYYRSIALAYGADYCMPDSSCPENFGSILQQIFLPHDHPQG